MRAYTPDKLRQFLDKSNPDIIIAEIRPADYYAGETKNNPWDMNEIVLPFARDHKIPIEPFDWWPNDLREKVEKFYAEYRKSPEGEKNFRIVDDEWAPFRNRFKDMDSVTPEYVHSPEFAKLETEHQIKVRSLVGEGPQNLMWFERAEKMNENLGRILDKYRGKRLTIVTGAFHRPDIERYLATRRDVRVVPLFR